MTLPGERRNRRPGPAARTASATPAAPQRQIPATVSRQGSGDPSMKALLCRAYGPPESLEYADAGLPAAAGGQIRIRVHAAGVNFPDVLMIAGKYQFRPEFPFAPGAECAGEVIEAGDGAAGFRPGDRVIAPTGHGAFAEEALADAARAVRIPDGMDYPEAAALMLAYGTSAHALIQRAALREGETLLVHGAAGGVGAAAVEIGKALGARVIATAGNDEKLAFAAARGADQGINYAEGPFRDRVKELTGGAGADVIYDPVGGEVFEQSLRCIAWEGRLLVVGFASGTIPSAPANLPLLKGCSVVGVFWGAWTKRDPAAHRANMDRLFGWWREGKVRPHVSLAVPLERGVEALQAVVGRKVMGKAVITVR